MHPLLHSRERVTPTAPDPGMLPGLQVINSQAQGMLTGRAGLPIYCWGLSFAEVASSA